MKIRDAIYLLMQKCKLFDGMFETVDVTGTAVNIPANGDSTLSATVSKDGYKPVGLTRVQNNKGSAVEIRGIWWNSSTEVSAYMHNNTNTAQNTSLYVTVVLAKSPLFGGYKPTRFNAFGTLKGVAICG